MADQAASERLDTALLQINEEEEETKQAEPAAPLPIYEFRKVYEDHDLVITVSLEDGKPIKGSITATTPQPPALSKEDLVAGKTPQPWLKRLESRELKFQEEAGKFIAQSPAMAYLDHQHSAKRLAGRVEAQAVFDAKSDQINFVFTIKNFEEPLKTGSGLLFEQVEDGFKVGLSAEATLTRAASEKTE
ncbi:MAG: hypothetical protein DCC75_14120 [Proteobacteria bacterium]|nr:MAG: hypothetical protein DCC75_14120 [Pseudomonadota bacterium]